MRENSDFATKINEIYVRLSGNPQRYVTGCRESESDGIIKGFGADCCKRRGGVAVPVVFCRCYLFEYIVCIQVM
jgi:DNA-binding Lrp family transcriptional regulator